MRDGALAGAHERISTNFRSNPHMLAALNAVFDTRARAPSRACSPANVALDEPPDAPGAKRPPIVLAIGELDPKTKADELRREEARTIAALLQTAHRERWEIRGTRPAVRSWTAG